MPRAKLEDLDGYLTTSTVADALGLSAYLIKARIADGSLPPASKVSESGVFLFDEDWMAKARETVADQSLRKRRRDVSGALPRIPSPERVLGHRPGEDGWIPTWDEVVSYFNALADATPRVDVEVLGSSTDGKPYLAVAVSAQENLQGSARERNRHLLGRLWDPRGGDETDIAAVTNEAKTVGIILASQHSTEIGATLMTLQLAYELASSEDPATLELLRNTISILVPSHNPDGIDMIAAWYRQWAGTEYVGSDLPFLYHPYTGHDNNRDWFMMTQAETRLYVELHNREHPQAVFDMHQMGRIGARYMVPPFIDPLDPNQHPIIQQGFASLGTHIAQRLTAAGKAGVVTNAIFDNYSPSLAYGNYHGSVDLLSEAASVKLATPVTIPEHELTGEHGYDPRPRTWNQPLPWKGGGWSIGDIVEYNLIAARAFLTHLSNNRKEWLDDYRAVNTGVATRTEKPYAFVIPRDQPDPGSAAELLDILQRGLVTVLEATAEIEIDGVVWPAGTRVVSLDQPAGMFAKTLLEIQEYPDLRRWPDGPPVPPYDVVGHSLPIQMGVNVVQVDRPLPDDAPLEPANDPGTYAGTATVASRPYSAWTIDARHNASIAAVSDFLAEDVPVYRAKDADPELGIGAGALMIPATPDREALVREISEGTGAAARTVSGDVDIPAWRHREIRLGVYKPWTACIDEGWARWVLEEFGVEFTTLENPEIRQGGLRDRFDAILVPNLSPKQLRDGLPEKNRYRDPNVPRYVGGVGRLGMRQLGVFAEDGGILIGIDQSSRALIEDLALPVRTPLAGKPDTEFYCPGSLLRVVMDTAHPLAYGMPRMSNILFMNSLVMEPAGGGAVSVATYPTSNPNQSGWILGSELLHGKSALMEVPFGQGRVVLCGFVPYFRAQTRGTYKVVFNAIARAGYEDAMFKVSD